MGVLPSLRIAAAYAATMQRVAERQAKRRDQQQVLAAIQANGRENRRNIFWSILIVLMAVVAVRKW